MRGEGSHHMPPHMMHQFHHQQPPPQQNGWRFSWINVVPIYTLCIVGYAIYIYFKAKSKPEEETRRNGIPKTELLELKDRLARTEQALTKLMEATKLISDKIDPKELEQLVGNQEFLAGLLKQEEAKQDDDNEVEDNDVDSSSSDKNEEEKKQPQSIEELEINSDTDSESDAESNDDDEELNEQTDEPIEIELKKINDDDTTTTPIRKRLVKSDTS